MVVSTFIIDLQCLKKVFLRIDFSKKKKKDFVIIRGKTISSKKICANSPMDFSSVSYCQFRASV